jgi:hypothetical protein
MLFAVMTEKTDYVRTDKGGVMRVADTRVPLDSVIAAFEQGASPETIQQQYPALSLELVTVPSPTTSRTLRASNSICADRTLFGSNGGPRRPLGKAPFVNVCGR